MMALNRSFNEKEKAFSGGGGGGGEGGEIQEARKGGWEQGELKNSTFCYIL